MANTMRGRVLAVLLAACRMPNPAYEAEPELPIGAEDAGPRWDVAGEGARGGGGASTGGRGGSLGGGGSGGAGGAGGRGGSPDGGGSGGMGLPDASPAGSGGTGVVDASWVVEPLPLDGLVAWYRAEEGTGRALVDEQGGPTLSVTAAATWVTGNPAISSRHAIRFSGGFATTAPSPASAAVAALSTAFSVAGWLYWDQPGAAGDQVIAGDGSLTWSLRLGGTSFPHLCLSIRTSTGSSTFCSESPVATRRWSHVAATWDGSAVRFFIDGVPSGGGFPKAGIMRPRSEDSLGLGCWGDGGDPLSGALDEVRIYKRALSVDEIARLAR